MADKKVCKVCFHILEGKDKKCPLCEFPAQTPHFADRSQCEEWNNEIVIPYREKYLKRRMERLPEYQEMLRRREAKKQEKEKRREEQEREEQKQAQKEKLLSKMRRDSSFCGTYGLFFEARIREDHTVELLGDAGPEIEEQAEEWTGIQAVAAGRYHLAGLREDGTVVAAGDNEDGQCEVFGWTDIVQIAACGNQTAALDSQGRVHVCGYSISPMEIEGWENIEKIVLCTGMIMGLTIDGTIRIAGDVWTEKEEADRILSKWKDIVDIAINEKLAIGLKKDGTVTVCPFDNDDVSLQNAKEVIAVTACNDAVACITGSGEILIRQSGEPVVTVRRPKGYNLVNLAFEKMGSAVTIYRLDEESPDVKIAAEYCDDLL